MYGIFTYMYHKNQPYMDGMGMTRSRILMDDNRSICAASTQALILMQILEAGGKWGFFLLGFPWVSFFSGNGWVSVFGMWSFGEVAGRGVFCVEIFMSFGSIIFFC